MEYKIIQGHRWIYTHIDFHSFVLLNELTIDDIIVIVGSKGFFISTETRAEMTVGAFLEFLCKKCKEETEP